MAMTYEQIALSWHPQSRRNYYFVLFAILLLVVVFVIAEYISRVQLPEKERTVKVAVPERIAKFIAEKPKPKPKPRQEVKKKPPPPKPKPKVPRKKPKEEKKLTKAEKKARKKAEQSGLLALSEELSDLIDTSNIDKMVGGNINKSGQSQQAASVDTNVLTQNAGAGSGGASGQKLSSVSGARLSDSERKIARELIGKRVVEGKKSADSGTAQRARSGNIRTEEDIAYIMDRNKSKLHRIYRKARRKNLGLKGKIVIEITVAPSGKVSRVIIKSSELNDPKLEADLLARIRLFDFGAKNVKEVTITYPIEFLPS